MHYLEDEAKKGFVAIVIILSVIFILGLIGSTLIDFNTYDYYNPAVAKQP